MRLRDYGDRVNQFFAATASASLTMLPDRAGLVTYVSITNPSATDTWVIQSQTKEIFRLPVATVGNQHWFSQSLVKYPNNNDIWNMYEKHFGNKLHIPIPKGQNLTIASVGGATANVDIYYEEYSEDSDIQGIVNHPQGKQWHIPTFGTLGVGKATVGEFSLDTTIRPNWCPDLFTGVAVPQGWKATILGMWLEAVSVNTFSGAANHVSTSGYLAFLLNARRLFTHPAQNNGLSLVAEVAAAGSANTGYTPINSRYPAFDFGEAYIKNWLKEPINIGPGDVLNLRLGTTGDATGTASYANAYQAMFVEVIQTS